MPNEQLKLFKSHNRCKWAVQNAGPPGTLLVTANNVRPWHTDPNLPLIQYIQWYKMLEKAHGLSKITYRSNLECDTVNIRRCSSRLFPVPSSESAA